METTIIYRGDKGIYWGYACVYRRFLGAIQGDVTVIWEVHRDYNLKNGESKVKCAPLSVKHQHASAMGV